MKHYCTHQLNKAITKSKQKYCKCLKQKGGLYLQTILSYNYFLQVGLIHEEREKGANHTQLTVRFETYNEICRYHKPSHSVPLFIP